MIALILNAFKNLCRRKVGTALTLVGIAVGVMSVAVIGALSDYGERAVAGELDSLGLNGLSVSACGSDSTLKYSDSELLLAIDGVVGASPYYMSEGYVELSDSQISATLWGTTSGNNSVFSSRVICGDDFCRPDIEGGEAVCLIDGELAKKLFGRENVVGKSIEIGCFEHTVDCEIIGVTANDSSILKSISGEMMPEFVYLPYTLMERFGGSENVGSIAVKVAGDADTDELSERILRELDQRKGSVGAYQCDNLSHQRDRLDSILSIVTGLLSAISVIALLVAGLGIMTVMLVSVNERTREIGVKKAIGAGFSAILLEFLAEALTISLIGGIMGAVLSVLLVRLGGMLAAVDIAVNPVSALSAVLSAAAFGVVFGVYPAVKAAKMKPVDALRHD